MEKELVVGMIGSGRIGRVHEANLRQLPGIRLKIISDRVPSQLDVWKDSPQYITSTKNSDLFDDPEIEAVFICASTDAHTKLIVEAANAGKQIFCEKPLSFDTKSIEKALAAVKRNNVTLQVGFNRRFDPSFRKIKESAEAGMIGRPHILKITSRDPEPPSMDYVAKSGGFFMDTSIHDFDTARYIVGSEIEEVYAVGDALVNPAIKKYDDIDTCVITLKFANGAMGVIDNSRRATYGYDQRLELFGDKGRLLANNVTPTTVQFANENGLLNDKPLYFFLERYAEAYKIEATKFIDAIRNNTPVLVNGHDGLMATTIALAAKESLKTHAPVKISSLVNS